MQSIKTSFKPNFMVALFIGGWLFLFIILIKPFQLEPLSNARFITMAIGYSLIAALCYMLIIPVQNQIFIKVKEWNLRLEITILFLFYLVTLTPSYIYHKSDFTNGLYDLSAFIIHIFLPSVVVVTPLLIFSRKHLVRFEDKTEDDLILKGTYKLDYLKIKLANLVCVSSSKNYVDVYYLERGSLTKKMIRTSLKKVDNDVPSLIRVHRSHLINPDHFRSWKNNKTLSLTQIDIPVSKNYKDRIASL